MEKQPEAGKQLSGTQRIIAFCRRHKLVVIPMAILIFLLPLLGLLALRNRHGARAQAISPIVYPSRKSQCTFLAFTLACTAAWRTLCMYRH